MPRLFTMPEVATGAEEATLSMWGQPEGAEFAAESVIATVETDKAVVDVESERAGILVRQLVTEGTSVQVGAPIALLADPGEQVADPEAALAALGVRFGALPWVPPADSREDVGVTSEGTAASDSGALTRARDNARIFISPLARKLAREGGLDASQIRGTGPSGRIRRRDVDAAIAERRTPDVSAAVGATPDVIRHTPHQAPEATTVATPREDNATELPHSRMRRTIARRLTESTSRVPHFYVKGTARVDRLLALRAELNDGAATTVSINDFVLKAVARALIEVPEMNVTWAVDALHRYGVADVAVAVATEAGLVTPVLRGVESLSITQVAETVKAYAAQARSGALRQEHLEGGSFTVSNLGMYGTEEFTGIINPPHAGLLAVGAARREPVIDDDGQLAVAHVLHVTLSADHRPVDGVVAARWMQAFLRLLEQPLRIIA